MSDSTQSARYETQVRDILGTAEDTAELLPERPGADEHGPPIYRYTHLVLHMHSIGQAVSVVARGLDELRHGQKLLLADGEVRNGRLTKLEDALLQSRTLWGVACWVLDKLTAPVLTALAVAALLWWFKSVWRP